LVNITLFSFTGLELLWLYVLPLVLIQTWLLGFTFRTWLAWMGLQLLTLFVCCSLVPLLPAWGFGALAGFPIMLLPIVLVGGLLWVCCFLWSRALPWFVQQAFQVQGWVPKLKRKLKLCLAASALIWWYLPLQSFPLVFRFGLPVLLGVALGQITGRYLRR